MYVVGEVFEQSDAYMQQSELEHLKNLRDDVLSEHVLRQNTC